jgi:hypothetical protein
MKIVDTFDRPYRRLDSSIAQLETPGGCAELMKLGRRCCLIAQRIPFLATKGARMLRTMHQLKEDSLCPVDSLSPC